MSAAIVYVDGYNLYYSLLRHSPYKWLDLVRLFERVLQAQEPTVDHVHVKFFTAPAIARYARHTDQAVQSQQRYHRALQTLYPDRFSLILGRHHLTEGWLPQSLPDAPIDHGLRHKVWQVEEKLTDVQIALHFYRDAMQGSADLQVICSNDTDMMPAMAMVRTDFPDQRIGLVAPLPEPTATEPDRQVATSLQEHAAWTRRYLRHDELLAAQLPPRIPTRKKPIIKPAYW